MNFVTRTALSAAIVAASVIGSDAKAQSMNQSGRSVYSTGFKSESTARSLSLWLTVVPVAASLPLGAHEQHELAGALLVTGLVFGPSAGYFYGDCPGRGVRGIVLRGLIGGVTAVLVGAAAKSYDPDVAYSGIGAFALAVGVGAIGAGVIIYQASRDISGVDDEVADRNRRAYSHSLSLSPTYFAEDKAPGLKVRLTL